MSQSSSADMSLRARAEITPDRLRLSYAVSNLSGRPLFLFNILHDEFDAGGFPLRAGGYVELTNGSVVVGAKLYPVPEDMDVEKPNIPFVTRLDTGGSFEGTITLPIPLTAVNPYSEAPSGVGAVVQKELYLEVGYFLASRDTERRLRRFPTDEGNRLGFDTFTEAEQRLQRTGPLGTVATVIPDQADG